MNWLRSRNPLEIKDLHPCPVAGDRKRTEEYTRFEISHNANRQQLGLDWDSWIWDFWMRCDTHFNAFFLGKR